MSKKTKIDDFLHIIQKITVILGALCILLYFLIKDVFHKQLFLLLISMYTCLAIFLIIGIFWLISDIRSFSKIYRKYYDEKDNNESNRKK